MALGVGSVGRGRTPPVAATYRSRLTITSVWAVLLLNVMSFGGTDQLLVPIPRQLGQAVAQGSLVVALLIAILINRRLVVRPDLFMLLLAVFAVLTVMVSLHNAFMFGSMFRAVRTIGFVVVLWILTPWWGARSEELLSAHLRVLGVVVGVVLVGLVISPGKALAFEGRLSGIIWPIPPTQVAHYSAAVVGLSGLLWLCHRMSIGQAIVAMALAGVALVMTHTRTALVAGAVGLVIAIGSLLLGSLRVRRLATTLAGFVVAVGVLFSEPIGRWMLRGQTAGEASQLTGRTKVWTEIVNLPRPLIEQLFGSGASNQSFDGLPIDNSWLAIYIDQGFVGVGCVALLLAILLARAVRAPRSPGRAIALFLVAYCFVASFTETGLGTASPYLLDLFVAAALLTGSGPR